MMSIFGSNLGNWVRARRLPISLLALALCIAGGSVLTTRAQSMLGTANVEVALVGQLISQKVDVPPVIDGELEAIWQSAPALDIALTWGAHGTEHAFCVKLRSAHTDEAVYFFASWEGSPPTQPDNTIRNQLTMHYDMAEPWPGARDVTCLVACHTAFTDRAGRLAHVIAETIPTGQTDALPSAGGWSAGQWDLEWSRPLLHENLFDVQFRDCSKRIPSS